MDFAGFAKRVQNIDRFIIQTTEEEIIKLEPVIRRLMQARLKIGKTVKGDTIQKGYSEPYGSKRRKKGLQTSFVDLKFSGKFYKGIFIEDTKAKRSKIEIDLSSNVEYADYLRRYDGVYGLDDKASKMVKQRIIKVITPKIKRYLTL